MNGSNKTNITYLLLMLQFFNLIFSPLVFAYPTLGTNSHVNAWEYFSLDLKQDKDDNTTVKNTYLHIYKGIKPSKNKMLEIQTKVHQINATFNIKILPPTADYQKNQYRIVIGPFPSSDIKKNSQLLKMKGVDNFPVWLSNGAVTLISPLVTTQTDKVHSLTDTDHTASFQYADTLSSIANVFDGVKDNVELEDRAKTFIQSETAQYTSAYMQNWLSQYGTANVNFALNSKFDLSTADADVLIPFNTVKNAQTTSTWFVQPGFVINDNAHYNGRDFTHIGLGFRQKNDHSFYGVNTFYDYDLTRNHQRAS
ncbi:hypothetical protein C9J21_22030, partial [Photobacterium phosphoreum]|uniref:inverse autotransporter beta domain-containing protein n=1 Tax=Photobacterium phosphoreum TaxID=659 RepID=UPI000D4C5348